VIGIDEQLVDVGAAGGEIGDDQILGTDNLAARAPMPG
jgi:hypothetical protein